MRREYVTYSKRLHGGLSRVARFRTLMQTGSALVALGLGCGVAAAAPPSGPPPAGAVASPVASGSPLRLIGRVHAKTAFCQQVYDHGGLATASALQGDADIDDDLQWLSTTDLDATELARQHGIAELSKRFTTLRSRARAAVDETKALRDVAASAPTAEQKDALVAYANALGGALHRQMVLAEAISRFMLYVNAHPAVSQQQRDEDYIKAGYTPLGPFEHSADPRDRVPPTLTEMARYAATELNTRRARERDDEVQAADHADAGFSPCSH